MFAALRLTRSVFTQRSLSVVIGGNSNIATATTQSQQQQESRKERRRREALEASRKSQGSFVRDGDLVVGRTGLWQVIIGIEVHAQINSNRKLFSDARTTFGVEPNTNVALLDAAFPGSLPRLNLDCVGKAIQTALALRSNINSSSTFDRKHYFYPDLPAGFQITQYRKPFAQGGSLLISLPSGQQKSISIAHIQLEQDSGKTVQSNLRNEVLVDLNRAGSGLMEIVSRPDMRSSDEAGAYTRSLQRLLRTVGSCTGNMDEGDMRCDVNVSVCQPDGPFGARVEIKNVNSVKFLCSAIDYEVDRQIKQLENGETVEQETRGFDSRTGVTTRLRSKESIVDYRFLPEPDLLPLQITQEDIELLKESLPMLPNEQQEKLQKDFGLSARDALTLMDEGTALQYFYDIVSRGIDPKLAANWIVNDLFAMMHAKEVATIGELGIEAERFGELLLQLADGRIAAPLAKRLLPLLVVDRRPLSLIVAEHAPPPLAHDELLRVCASVVDESLADPAALKAMLRVQSGDDRTLKHFVGRVLRATNGRANAVHAEQTLKTMILNKKIK